MDKVLYMSIYTDQELKQSQLTVQLRIAKEGHLMRLYIVLYLLQMLHLQPYLVFLQSLDNIQCKFWIMPQAIVFLVNKASELDILIMLMVQQVIITMTMRC